MSYSYGSPVISSSPVISKPFKVACILFISSPADGLQAYDSTNKIPRYFDNTRWRAITDPTNVIKISTQTDWNDLVSGGTLTITVNTTVFISTTISTADEIVINSGISFSLLGNKISTAGILYTGASTFISATNPGFLRVDGINTMDGNSTGTLFNITGSTIFVEHSNSGVFNWSSLGSITDSAQFRVLSVGYFNSGAGFTNDNVGVSFFSGMVLANAVDMSSAFVNIIDTDVTTNVVIQGTNVIFLQANESLVNVDAAIGSLSSIEVTNNVLTGPGNLF